MEQPERDKVLVELRRLGVSADLIEKIAACYESMARWHKPLTATGYLIYYLERAGREASAVAALGQLVAEEEE